MPRLVDINIRDHVRYTGDGLPGEPVNAPLPIGDPSSGVYHPTKKDIRDAIGDVQGDRIRAEEAAAAAEAAMLDVQGASFYAADTATLLANAATSYPAGTVFATRNGGYSYQVVSSNPDLTTAGGVMLRVLPSAGYLPLEAFGLPTSGDAAPVVKRWIERGLALRNVTMTARSRVSLETLVDAHFPATGSGFPVHRPVIDTGGAVFIVPNTNTVGGIKITKYNNAQHLTIRNMDIQSDMPRGDAVSATSGVGLEIYSALRPVTPGFGSTGESELTLENVRVGSANHNTGSPGRGRWTRGIVVDGFFWPRLQNCEVFTNHPSDRKTKNFEAGEGIRMMNCYSPMLNACQSLGRFDTNIRISENTGMPYEDFQVTNCYGVGGRIGLLIESQDAALQAAALKEPGGSVIGGHFNGQQNAIRIRHRRQFTVVGPLLYTTLYTDDAVYADAAALLLDNCTDAQASVIVPEGGHYNADNDAMSGVLLIGTCKAINIVNCQFGNRGIGIRSLLNGFANNITVQGSIWGNTSGYGPTKKHIDATGAVSGPDILRIMTPGMQFGGAAAGMTTSEMSGGVVRNGQLVTFWLDVNVTAKGTSTGEASISAAALPPPASGSDFGATISYSSGATSQVLARVGVTGNIALFKMNASGQMSQPMTDTDFSNAFSVRLSGTYIAA